MKSKIIILSLLGFWAVALGAFGAHGLKNYNLEPKIMHAYETAVQYHFYHLLAMAFIVVIDGKLPKGQLNLIFRLFFIGILCFSGSLYGITFAAAAGYSMSWLGPITPIGGVIFMTAWALLGYNAYKSQITE
jgi:uncharacterized membrane protein YgdD (TMEM256/DUF423 family)